MSLQTNVGRESSLFDIGPEHAEQVLINSPVLSQAKLRQLLGPTMFADSHAFIDLNVDADADACRRAGSDLRAGRSGGSRVANSWWCSVTAICSKGSCRCMRCSRPALCIITWFRPGCRCDANIVVETGVARDAHHFACLIGYGATMIYPYLVYQSLHDIARRGNIQKQQQLGRSYRRGIRKGLFKVMSKMGISSISSYRGAQLFEIVGLDDEIVDGVFAAQRHGSRGAISATCGTTSNCWPKRPGIRGRPSSRAACTSMFMVVSTTATTRMLSRHCRRPFAAATTRAMKNTPSSLTSAR